MKRAFVIAMECEADAVRPALRDGDTFRFVKLDGHSAAWLVEIDGSGR